VHTGRSIAVLALCGLVGLALLLSGCSGEPEDLVASEPVPESQSVTGKAEGEPKAVADAGSQETASVEAPEAQPEGEPDVKIAYILHRGRELGTEGDEYVEIANFGDASADIACWTLRKVGEPEKIYRFDSSACDGESKTLLGPGETVWVFTNRCSEISGSHSFGSEEGIWDNDTGTGQLLDCDGNIIDEYAY